MAAVNAFLKDFLEMRKALPTASQIVGNPKPANPETRKRKEKFKKEQEVDKPGLQTIIEEKPNRKVVIAYLQHRANDLSVEKMSK